jgi:maltose O-acetyltransferase
MGLFKTIYRRFIRKMSSQQMDLEELIERGMKVGKDSHLFSSEFFDHIYPHLITIGNNVTISTNVTILAHDASTNVVDCSTKLGRVDIGNNVFIGAQTTILCNTRIGDNVVVGAGSVVSRDLPDNGVYAGVPARRICSIEEYRQKNAQLLSTRPDFSKIHPWYEWPNASEEELSQMYNDLADGVGFV